jgi:hypothetical protein
MELRTSNHYAGKGQQQYSSQSLVARQSPADKEVSRRIFGVGSRYLAMASEDYNRLT